MRRALLNIRADERRAVIGAFVLLFGILAGHTLLETARDALFLASLPASQLPWVYLAIAALALAASEIGARRHGRHTLPLWLGLSSLVTAGFWVVAADGEAWSLYAIYIWSGVFVSVAMVQFWLAAGQIFTIDQAKRVYGFIGAGSVGGAIVGAAVAAALSTALPARHMLLAASVFIGLSALTPLILSRTPDERPDEFGGPLRLFDSIRGVFDHPYVARLAGLVVVSTAAFTLVDYIFKAEVAESVAAEDLGSFFATFYMVLNIAALGAQVLLTGVLLRNLGVQRVLWLVPLLLLGFSGLAIVGAGLAAAIALKSSDGVFKHSVHRTAQEVLFLPISDRLRPGAKRFIDMVGRRTAQALASLAILAVVGAGGDERVLAVGVAALSILWVISARALKPHYLELFRENLRRGRIDSRVSMPKLDLGALESLIAALNSPDDAEVMTSLDILAGAGRGHLIPALILHHPSRAVVTRGLEVFVRVGRTDHLPILERLMRHADPEIRAAVLRTHPDEALVEAAVEDGSPLVRATALVARVSAGEARADSAMAALEALVAEGGPRAHIGLARAIARQPHPAFGTLLTAMAESPVAAVRVAVAEAMEAAPEPAFITPLIEMLAQRDVRSAARRALVAIGAPALEELGQALADPTLPFGLRRHLPRAIGRFRTPRAAEILVGRLLEEDSGMIRYRMLRGLARIRAHDPDLPLDERVLEEATDRTLRAAFTLLDWRMTLERGAREEPDRRTPGYELLVRILADKEANTIERLLLLLGLLVPEEDFHKIYRGLRSTNRVAAGSSLELLENILPASLKDPVIGLVTGLVKGTPDLERVYSGGRYYDPRVMDYDVVLVKILGSGSESLQALAAYHVGELGMTEMRHHLAALAVPPESYAAEVIERAIERLEGHGTRPALSLAKPASDDDEDPADKKAADA